jgi:hypothetical protein
MVSGAPGAYWGANLKRVEHSSHFPLNDDIRLSVGVSTWRWMVNIMRDRGQKMLTVTSGNI